MSRVDLVLTRGVNKVIVDDLVSILYFVCKYLVLRRILLVVPVPMASRDFNAHSTSTYGCREMHPQYFDVSGTQCQGWQFRAQAYTHQDGAVEPILWQVLRGC